MPLSIWQYEIEERVAQAMSTVDTSNQEELDMIRINIINDYGFELMCCRKSLIILPTPYVMDNMADLLVVEGHNGKIRRERGWVAKANEPLPSIDG
jgi:hypothetical protein